MGNKFTEGKILRMNNISELENLIWHLNLTEPEALDLLFQAGVLSSRCSAVRFIAPAFRERCVRWLMCRGGYRYQSNAAFRPSTASD
jgi:hypothetical protein